MYYGSTWKGLHWLGTGKIGGLLWIRSWNNRSRYWSKFLPYLKNYLLLKKHPAPCSQSVRSRTLRSQHIPLIPVSDQQHYTSSKTLVPALTRYKNLAHRHGPVVNIWSGTEPARLPSTTGESERSLQGRHLTLQDEPKQSKQPAVVVWNSAW